MTDKLSAAQRQRFNQLLRKKSVQTPHGIVQLILSDDELKEYYQLQDIIFHGRPLLRDRNFVPLEDFSGRMNDGE